MWLCVYLSRLTKRSLTNQTNKCIKLGPETNLAIKDARAVNYCFFNVKTDIP